MMCIVAIEGSGIVASAIRCGTQLAALDDARDRMPAPEFQARLEAFRVSQMPFFRLVAAITTGAIGTSIALLSSDAVALGAAYTVARLSISAFMRNLSITLTLRILTCTWVPLIVLRFLLAGRL
jgi:hypothetical protein